ncbi:hypothetical protein U1Q18_019026 [Sarracenia purpurea var. burkii]
MALSVLPALFQNLNFLIQKEFGLLWGVDKEMKRLSSTLSVIQSVIEDAEEKQFRDKAVRDWLQKLKYAAFELDDILDDCSTETLKWEYKHHGSGSLKKVRTSFLTCYPVQNVLFRHKIGTRMKEIIENLSAIADERSKFHLRETVAEEKGIELVKRRETSSLLTQPQLYGRDEDREKIVKVLVKDVCDREGVSVYPIVVDIMKYSFDLLGKNEAQDFLIRNRNYEMYEIGCTTWFKMHDLVHDLAQIVMEDECQIIWTESKFGSLRVVHGEGSRMMNSKFGSFRVVHGRGSRMMNLTSSIGNLKHLRFLDLSGTLIKQLPDAICSLWNLQTLILDDCVELKRLPKNMNHLRGLRHFYLKDCPLIGMPPKIGRLTCLKALSLFVVGKSISCHLAEMQCLNLGGKLRIEHLERVRNPTHAKDANLMGKQNLTWLELAWGHIGKYESQENVEELLEALEPHASLKGNIVIIKLIDCKNSILGNIVIIKLIDCKNCSQLPPLGQLPLLRRVKTDNMDKLEYIDNDLPGDDEVSVRRFPSLEVLKIISLPNLEGLSREEGKDLTSLSVSENEEAIYFPEELLRNLTHLESLSIHDFSKLQMFPDDLASLIALKSLAIDNCLVLESLPVEGLRSLGSLQNLEISGCCKLSSLSEGLGHLTSLETLDISECPELVAFPDGVKHLNSLQHLSLDGGMNWHTDIFEKSVPLLEGLQYIPALQSLWISSYGIASLPD